MAYTLIIPVCSHVDAAKAAANIAAKLPNAAVFNAMDYADEAVRLAAEGKADDWFDLLVGRAAALGKEKRRHPRHHPERCLYLPQPPKQRPGHRVQRPRRLRRQQRTRHRRTPADGQSVVCRTQRRICRRGRRYGRSRPSGRFGLSGQRRRTRRRGKTGRRTKPSACRPRNSDTT